MTEQAAQPFVLEEIAGQVETLLLELMEKGSVRDNQLIVIGTSTSEVMGHHIGTSGTEDVAAQIFEGVKRARAKRSFYPAFQCCEHLNRALVVESSILAHDLRLEPVTVVPVRKAGGSMAAYAYRHLQDPVVVEMIEAHAGIDIGETLIAMHLKRVAVPLRPSIRYIGQARVTMAYTRPKLIGGQRAVYALEEPAAESGSCS